MNIGRPKSLVHLKKLLGRTATPAEKALLTAGRKTTCVWQAADNTRHYGTAALAAYLGISEGAVRNRLQSDIPMLPAGEVAQGLPKRPLQILGKSYESVGDAARALKVSRGQLQRLIHLPDDDTRRSWLKRYIDGTHYTDPHGRTFKTVAAMSEANGWGGTAASNWLRGKLPVKTHGRYYDAEGNKSTLQRIGETYGKTSAWACLLLHKAAGDRKACMLLLKDQVPGQRKKRETKNNFRTSGKSTNKKGQSK